TDCPTRLATLSCSRGNENRTDVHYKNSVQKVNSLAVAIKSGSWPFDCRHRGERNGGPCSKTRFRPAWPSFFLEKLASVIWKQLTPLTGVSGPAYPFRPLSGQSHQMRIRHAA